MNPPWLDQVLFDLQSFVPAQLTDWERNFLPSVSLQVGRGQTLTTPQQLSLLRMYKRYFPNRAELLSTFQPFDPP